MPKATFVASAMIIALGFLAGPVWAQGAPQTIRIERVDVQKVAAGYRASKIVGSTVVNDANEMIGRVDDLLVEPNSKVPYVVLSVGGFLGMGERLVILPFGSLKIGENRVALPGGTKDELKALPEFRYAHR